MFIRNNFQFNRGIPNAQAQGESLTSIMHSYRSETDIAATILAPGYFSDHFDENDLFVIPGDTIIVTAADSVVMTLVLDTAPVVLSANLFNTSPSILIGLPVAAINASALTLSAGILRAQIADATHPGIITEVAQTIGGAKKFATQVRVVAGNDIPGTVPLVTNGVRIQGDSNSIGYDILMLNNSQTGAYIFDTQALGSFGGMLGSAAGFNVAEPQILIGTLDTSIIFGSSIIYCDSPFNVNLINAYSGNVVTINSIPGANTFVSGFTLNSVGGLTFPPGSPNTGGTITNFNTVQELAFDWSGPFAAPIAGSYSLLLFNSQVTIVFKGISNGSLVNEPIVSTASIIPAYALPSTDKFQIIPVITGVSPGENTIGSAIIDTLGNVTIYSDLNAAGFTEEEMAGFQDFSITYDLQF